MQTIKSTILMPLMVAVLAVTALRTSAADFPTNGLIGYWNFNEAGGEQVMDSSAGGHHGVLRGGVRTFYEKFGNVVDCQRNALVEIPHTASLDQLPAGVTVAAWVNRRTNTAWNTVVSREIKGGTSEYFGLAVVKNKALFSIDPDGAHYQNIKSETDMPVGEWIHLAGTYDNAKFKLYVNGRLVKSAACAIPFRFQDQNPILIGGNSNNQGQSWVDCFHGIIDEVRMFNRALSERELEALVGTTPASNLAQGKVPPEATQDRRL